MGKLKVFEAFAGIGSQRMALRNLNINHEVVGICEIDKFAIESYKAIHGEINNLGDISKVSIDDIPDHDLLTYSFPCTSLSRAGKQEGLIKGKTKSGLLYECERIIENKRPKYLLLENVRDLVSKKFKEDFDKWLKYLENLGYKNYWKIINAKHCNIPQNRERVFVVSIRNDLNQNFEFSEIQELTTKVQDLIEDKVSDSYYVDMKDKINLIIKDNKVLIPQATKKGYIEMMLGGVCDLSYPTSKTRRGRVQGNGTVCPTLTATKQSIVIIEKDAKIRNLTAKECWRLMGFSDEDYEKASGVCSENKLYKQAGNAIVVNVLESIFKNLLIDYIK